jgi:hypothetical protein
VLPLNASPAVWCPYAWCAYSHELYFSCMLCAAGTLWVLDEGVCFDLVGCVRPEANCSCQGQYVETAMVP